MAKEFICPECASRLRVPDERVGEIITCPQCSGAVATADHDALTVESSAFEEIVDPVAAPDEAESFLELMMAEESPEDRGSRIRLSEVRIVTSPNIQLPRMQIIETLEAVHALRVIAMGPISDLKTIFRDAVGGRARTAEAIFEKAREEVIADLKRQAVRQHAQAIVSLNIEIGELNQSIVFVSGVGTPVRLERVP